VPTRPDEINPFIEQCNLYIDELRANVVDLKQWERVKRAWWRMTGAG
jgi:hypothetical protein